ncbi:MAG: T9SS type A sorting domain-containing protein, partial [Ignavibacteriae bacterium]|nr:T9SS type A sorting domain-containing protein [Ignavibacteriota bacterium]
IGIKKIGNIIPEKSELSQNYPNPFNPYTNIKFQIKTNSFVTLKVYDILGMEIITLVMERLKSGLYQVQFSNNQLSSGIYFYKLETEDFSAVKSMILIK